MIKVKSTLYALTIATVLSGCSARQTEKEYNQDKKTQTGLLEEFHQLPGVRDLTEEEMREISAPYSEEILRMLRENPDLKITPPYDRNRMATEAARRSLYRRN
jgi:PBP1b-binding outer membrane lipoprotein LpoB